MTGTGSQSFDQNTPGIFGAAEAGDGAVWLLSASGDGLLADGSRSYSAVIDE